MNAEIVAVQRIQTEAGKQQLHSLLTEHVTRTGSKKGKEVLDNFEEAAAQFWQLVPPSEQMSPEANPKLEDEATNGSQVVETYTTATR